MNKSEWEEAYSEFDKAHSELFMYQREYKHGSNKKKREQADRQMGYVKHRIEYLFNKYPEVYKIATGGEKSTDFGKAIIMDEFFQNRYIVDDLGKILVSMKEKIKSIEDSTENNS